MRLESTTICGVGSLARLAAPLCEGTAALRVELHGYLSYIEMCAVTGRECTIYTKGSIQRYAVLANTGGKRGI